MPESGFGTGVHSLSTMAKKKAAPAADEHAISFLGFGRQYQKAANLLCEADKTLKVPTYFMYLHAIELALKAFLRAANLPVVVGGKRKHHQITELYEECKKLGLRIGPDDSFDIQNVVALLDDANKDQGFRYFTGKGSSIPEMSWTRDTVENLFRAVEPSVKKRAEADGVVPGRAVKFDLMFSKPYASPTKSK